MKQILLLTSAMFLITQICGATACQPGSLADYIALGPGGCTIANNTLSNFQTVSGTAGATGISPGSIGISPIGGALNPGLTATVNVTANTGTLFEALFSYRISGSRYTADSITLTGSSESADGAVTDIQNFCAGGTFGPSGVTGCSGIPGSLLTLDGIQNHDSALLSPVSLVTVTDDFTLDGGLAGSATGGSITDQFTAVPEPASLLFTALGFAVAVGLKSRSTLSRRLRNKRRSL